MNAPELLPELLREPWLRGPLPGVNPLVTPVFHSFLQVREDLAKHTSGLQSEQVWRAVAGTSLGFHLKHIAGSVDRLATYLDGEQLTAAQLEYLRHESEPGEDLSILLIRIEDRLTACEKIMAQIPLESLADSRSVGRRALPTTVIGLVVHLAEHTQRHLGQAVTLAKLLRQTS